MSLSREATRSKIDAARQALAVADQTLAGVPEVDEGQWAAAVAQRQAQALAANYGDVDVSPTEIDEGGERA